MSEIEAAKIAVRLDRLPRSWTIFRIVTLVSLAGGFEFYELFLTGYIAPQMARSQMFSATSIGVFAGLKSISVAGIGTFVFCTFAGMWAGVLIFSQFADWYGRRTVLTWSLIWYLGCSTIMAFQHSGQQIDIWRFLAGLGFSVQLVAIDAYICEIVPMAERGRAFALNQFITFCVVPIVALLAWRLQFRQPWGWDGWRWVIMTGSLGMVAIWAIRAAIPESPRWLALPSLAA
jgi:putative MFS transporter